MQIAADGLKGRVFEVSLADLQSVSVWLAKGLLNASDTAHADFIYLHDAE